MRFPVRLIACCLFALLACVGTATARAEMLSSLPGLEGLGSFTGEFNYSASSSTTAALVVKLTNTSPVANGGYLHAFAFNNPGDKITSVSLASTDADFELLGGPGFDNGIKAPPYGYFDIGSSSTGSWLSGGNPSTGLAVGESATFTFTLGGTDLNTLTAKTFFAELSTGGDGKALAFAARFRGFVNGGSDKVGGKLEETPEPSSALLAGLGVFGFAVVRLSRRRKG